MASLTRDDPIKAGIAIAVQHHMLTEKRPELLPMPGNVDKVVCYAVGPLETRLKVYLDDDTVRTFTIKLSENNV
jgi:hypothetical protein